MIRYTFLLLHMIGPAQDDRLHDEWSGDAMIRSLIEKSECIASATIVELGRRVTMEDGVAEYEMRCVVDENFKGKQKTGDTITVHIVEFTMNLGGKFGTDEKDTSLFVTGNKLVFFLQPGGHSITATNPQHYEPVDCLLGAMQPSEQLVYYLRMNMEKH